jgi:predicted Zn finger-like uncharacterized protein
MILTCPQCATRYQIPDNKFPPEGRKVRCAKCGQVWFQATPAPEPEPAPASAAGVDRASPRFAGPQSRPDLSGDAAGAPQAPKTPKRQRAPGERMAAVAGWIGLIAVLGLIIWGGIHYREAIAQVWPQTASLYAALGLPANRGIAFENVNYRRETQAGQPVLIVNVTVVNANAREVTVPHIQVVLMDSQQRSVDRWIFAPPQKRLSPGARMTFTTSRANPPPSARHLDIRFAGAAR